MDISHFIDVFRHLDRYLNDLAGSMGSGLYGLLFLIVFCETGLVVTPFLPGDSLLFAVGALAAAPGSPLSLPAIIALLFVAAVVGDAVNYAIGRRVGPAAFRSERSWLFNKKHLVRTQAFYEKHGPQTIIIARFVPIVRTFAPFVAGIGQMRYPRFFTFNVIGAAGWVTMLSLLGFFFGRTTLVQNNFELVILAIVGISVLPLVVEVIRARRAPAGDVPEPAAK
jgi:membrane-associated protein